MRSFRCAAFVVTVTVACLLTPALGLADLACRATCFQRTRQCIVEQARAGLFACKLDCATGSRSDLPDCLRQCRDQFRADRTHCREQLTSCNDVCTAAVQPGYDYECLGSCGTDLAACGQRVASDAHDCAIGCADFPGRLGIDCLYGCVETAKAEGVECGSDFRACAGRCGSQPSLP